MLFIKLIYSVFIIIIIIGSEMQLKLMWIHQLLF